jgi:hypothetical protein
LVETVAKILASGAPVVTVAVVVNINIIVIARGIVARI